MHLWDKIFSYIELAGSIQGIFLALVLFRLKAKERKAHRILALLVLVTTYLLIWAALHDSRLLVYVPDLFPSGPAVTFLIGPLLFFYVKSMIHPDILWKRSYLLHLIPFLAFLAFQFPFWLKTHAEKTAILVHHHKVDHVMAATSQIPSVIILLYLIPMVRMLNRYGNHINQYYSNTDHIKLQWLRDFMYGFGFILTVFIVTYLFSGIHLSGNIICILLAIAIYFISFKSMRSPVFYNNTKVLKNGMSTQNGIALKPASENTEEKLGQEKYLKSGLKEDEIERCIERLTGLMEKEHLYRKKNLTLKELAENLSLPSHQLPSC